MIILASCKKDSDNGGNTPGGGSQTVEMRISKISQTMVIYEEESTDGGQTWNVIDVDSGQTNQIFTWNNNLLSNIKQEIVQDGGECEEIDYDFRYDNNKLSNVIMTMLSYGGSTPFVTSANVTYDGDNMSEVTVHYDDGYDRVYHLEYSDGKLSSVADSSTVFNYF